MSWLRCLVFGHDPSWTRLIWPWWYTAVCSRCKKDHGRPWFENADGTRTDRPKSYDAAGNYCATDPGRDE